jgi:hypothetical protein
VNLQLSNIPVKDSFNNYGYPTRVDSNVSDFSFSTDDPKNFSINDSLISYSIGGGNPYDSYWDQYLSFVLDTNTNYLRKFYVSLSSGNGGHRISEYDTILSFDSIHIAKVGDHYRAFMSGGELLKNSFYFGGSSSEQLGVAAYNHSKFEMRSYALTDNSSVEVLIYGFLPLEVKKMNSHGSFFIYPNPASSIFHFTSDEPKEFVELYDSFGRKFQLTTSFSDGVATADISKLPSGCYQIKVGNMMQKLVILR